MSYQERQSLVSAMSTVVIVGVYAAFMAQRYPETDPYSAEVFHFWGSFFLILILVSIVAKIIIYIVFSIINTIATHENEPSITDERDRLIELKAIRNSIYVFSFGFAAAMVALAMDQSPSTMFIILLCAGTAADIISDLSQFYFYRRGV